MNDADRIAAFMRLAREEFGAARLLSASAPRQAGHLLQQAVENAARALLTQAGVSFGAGHDLGQMAAALDGGHPLRAAVDAMVSTAGSKFRYPSPAEPLVPPPSQGSLATGAAEVRGFLEQVSLYLDGTGAREPGAP